MPVYHSTRTTVPESLKRHDHWVLWGLDEQGRKRPLAPWLRGDLYPVKWGSDAPQRPETDWERAYEAWQALETFAAPDGMDRDSIMPAPLLLHDPLDPPLMQVDFDDVRDTETGRVSDEVADIVDQLGGFCEISQSGAGLHVFVRAELPGGLGKFIGSLADIGDIELYDHGRAVGATWDHVEGTPTDVPHVQDEIKDIIMTYEDSSQRQRRLAPSHDEHPGAEAASEGTDTGINDAISDAFSEGSDKDADGPSPYFDVDARIGDTGHFSRYRRDAPGDQWTGPHPVHGPQHSDPDECTNFGIDTSANVWFCFAHDAGGRGIELAAVLCEHTDINCRDVPGSGQAVGGWLRDRPQELLATCLWLRDQGAVGADAKPPYDALLAVADLHDLHVRDEQAGILGEGNAKIARAIFDEMSVADLN